MSASECSGAAVTVFHCSSVHFVQSSQVDYVGLRLPKTLDRGHPWKSGQYVGWMPQTNHTSAAENGICDVRCAAQP